MDFSQLKMENEKDMMFQRKLMKSEICMVSDQINKMFER